MCIEIVLSMCFAKPDLLSWRANVYLKMSERRERSLAVPSEGKPFRKALKFSRGLGAALQRHFVFNPLKDVH